MFVTGEPAIKIRKTLIISDVHLGFEYEYWRRGIFIPDQTDYLIKRLNDLIEKTNAKKVVINGDLKHTIASVKRQEKSDIEKFMNSIKAEITVIAGNHDGGLDMKMEKYLMVGKNYVLHGHTRADEKILKKASSVIIGHNHPILVTKDYAGRHYTRVWVIGNYMGKRIVIMPAFNPFIGGEPVNNKKFMGPVAKKIENAKVYLLDGTYVANVEDLESV